MQKYSKYFFSLPHLTAFYRILPHLTAFYRILPIEGSFAVARTANDRLTNGKRSDECGNGRVDKGCGWGVGREEWGLRGTWRQRRGRVEVERSYGEATAKVQRRYSEVTAVEKNGAKKVNISKKICTFAIII